ncbi:hypothetical protein N7526_000710 [Penicillium atrosanguineum]|nr:hypothetical protein N7526_000710 [Penicillium atrosanguineum]
MLYSHTIEVSLFKLRSLGLSIDESVLQFWDVCKLVGLKVIYDTKYIVFCCLLCVLIFVVCFVFPDTKDRILEDIDKAFEGKEATLDEKVVDDSVERETFVAKKSEIR